MNRRTGFLPSTRSGIFITICLAIALISVLGVLLLFELGSASRSEKMTGSILLLVAVVTLSLACLSMIAFGIRTARHQGVSFKTVRMPTVGLILCLFLAFVSWWVSGNFDESLMNMRARYTKEAEGCEFQGPDKYSEATEFAARNRFVMTGEATRYTTPEGEVVPYEPTAADREEYWSMQFFKDYLAFGRLLFRRTMYFWLALGLSGILIGLLTPIRKKTS